MWPIEKAAHCHSRAPTGLSDQGRLHLGFLFLFPEESRGQALWRSRCMGMQRSDKGENKSWSGDPVWAVARCTPHASCFV